MRTVAGPITSQISFGPPSTPLGARRIHGRAMFSMHHFTRTPEAWKDISEYVFGFTKGVLNSRVGSCARTAPYELGRRLHMRGQPDASVIQIPRDEYDRLLASSRGRKKHKGWSFFEIPR